MLSLVSFTANANNFITIGTPPPQIDSQSSPIMNVGAMMNRNNLRQVPERKYYDANGNFTGTSKMDSDGVIRFYDANGNLRGSSK